MAKTNFSGPITSGFIRNTTGTIVGTNVRNVGFVETAQTFNINYADLNAEATSIATPAGNAVGVSSVTISTGTNYYSGHVNPSQTTVVGASSALSRVAGRAWGGALSFTETGVGSNAAISMTVFGEDVNGVYQTEVITGPAGAATVLSANVYAWVYSITFSAPLVGPMNIGWNPAVSVSTFYIPCRSEWNVTPQGQTSCAGDGQLINLGNLANNIVIPKDSRITLLTGTVPDNNGIDFGTSAVFGFGTSSQNVLGTIGVDADYFSITTVADLTVNTGVVYNSLTGCGNATAAMINNHLNVSHSDSAPAASTCTGEIDKELMIVGQVAGADATQGELLINCHYLQQLNVFN